MSWRFLIQNETLKRLLFKRIASNADTSHIVASQDALSRISRIEDGVWYDRNTFMQEQERNAETTREYHAKVDLTLARTGRLINRLHTQDWYRELSDQESEDEIDRMLGDEPHGAPPRRSTQRVRVPTADVEQWINQFREEFRNNAVDGDTLTQRFTQFLEERQRREEHRRSTLEQRLEHFRNEYVEAMTETAVFHQ